jgi:Glycosyl transferase family 2.
MRIEFLLFITITAVSSVLSVTYYLLNSYLSRKRNTPKEKSEGLTPQDATIVITVFNESVEHLKRAIASVRDQVSEIIVVGDGC